VYFWIFGLYVIYCGFRRCLATLFMCCLSFINVVCEILKSICGLYKCMFCLSHGKAKQKKEKRGSSPSAW
jgi:hypothetical protein